MRDWKYKDGTVKLHQIRTSASFDKTAEQLEKYMEFLEIPPQDWRLLPDSYTGKVMLVFHKDEVHYLITSEKQTRPKGKPSIKDNARAIFHIMQARVLEMRKGVETLESAFGGFINWLTTPKFPPRMMSELDTREVLLVLPESEKNQEALEVFP